MLSIRMELFTVYPIFVGFRENLYAYNYPRPPLGHFPFNSSLYSSLLGPSLAQQSSVVCKYPDGHC